MTPEMVTELARQALETTLLVSSPILGLSLFVGLVISALQAMTQMNEGTLTLRWAEFKGGKPGPSLSAKGKVVTLSELRGQLPAGTRFVTPEQRKAQLAERAASYAWRIAES